MNVVSGCRGIEQCWLFKVNGASLRITESVPNGTLALYSLCSTLLLTTIGNKGDIWDTDPWVESVEGHRVRQGDGHRALYLHGGDVQRQPYQWGSFHLRSTYRALKGSRWSPPLRPSVRPSVSLFILYRSLILFRLSLAPFPFLSLTPPLSLPPSFFLWHSSHARTARTFLSISHEPSRVTF